MYDQVLHSLNSVPQDVWSTLAEAAVSAVVVSPVMVGIKKWFQVDEEKKMLFLVMLGSMAAAAVTYLLTVPQFAPWIILIEGWLAFATTQPLYLYFVKPVSRRLGIWFSAKVAEAAAINEAKSAAVPAAGLPITATPGAAEDFSH